MNGVRQGHHRSAVAGLAMLLLPVAACGSDNEPPQPAEDESRSTIESTPSETGTGAPTPTVNAIYPIPEPLSGRRETYIQFRSGQQGFPNVSAVGRTECDVNPHSGTRTFSASTSDFSQFDHGSTSPGADFSLELVMNGPTPVGNSLPRDLDEPPYTLSLSYVTTDGAHHTLHAQDAGLAVNSGDVTDIRSVGFSATTSITSPEPPHEVSVTGYIFCTTMQQVP